MRNPVHILFCLLLVIISNTLIANENSQPGFSESDRNVIQQYFAPAPAPDLPPGMVFNNASLKKKKLLQKKPLPPGLAAQLQKNGTLPPGLAKNALPADLEKKLPAVTDGYERAVLDDLTVVLIEVATNRIVDLVHASVTKE